MTHVFEGNLKTIGMVPITQDTRNIINSEAYTHFIKAMYLPAGCRVKVDFTVHETSGPALFFISPNQVLELEELCTDPGYFIYYNRDFYCIQLNDNEVACDGLLFNNINNMPMTAVPEDQAAWYLEIFKQIEAEFSVDDTSQEEMLRIYLKQLLIKATRLWKRQHLHGVLTTDQSDPASFRTFTRLVDAHYKEKHSVADYADLMLVAPKTLAHRFKKMNLPQPNDIIKNRIILEAKRLLVYTSRTAKEIAYDLGYEDPAYFSRMFFIKTGVPPSTFRERFLGKGELAEQAAAGIQAA